MTRLPAHRKRSTAKSKRKSVDDRETAQIWACTICLAMREGIKTDYRGFDFDLAFAMNEANIMRIMLLVACKQADIEIDELRACIQEVIEAKITKKARAPFEVQRQRIAGVAA